MGQKYYYTVGQICVCELEKGGELESWVKSANAPLAQVYVFIRSTIFPQSDWLPLEESSVILPLNPRISLIPGKQLSIVQRFPSPVSVFFKHTEKVQLNGRSDGRRRQICSCSFLRLTKFKRRLGSLRRVFKAWTDFHEILFFFVFLSLEPIHIFYFTAVIWSSLFLWCWE